MVCHKPDLASTRICFIHDPRASRVSSSISAAYTYADFRARRMSWVPWVFFIIPAIRSSYHIFVYGAGTRTKVNRYTSISRKSRSGKKMRGGKAQRITTFVRYWKLLSLVWIVYRVALSTALEHLATATPAHQVNHQRFVVTHPHQPHTKIHKPCAFAS